MRKLLVVLALLVGGLTVTQGGGDGRSSPNNEGSWPVGG